MVAALFVFMIVIMVFRQSVSQIGKDPSLNIMNTAATFKVAAIINLNKNNYPDRLEECWNQMNPLIDCSPENTITEGNYTTHGVDGNWLEKTEIFEIPEEQLKRAVRGLIADRVYYQKVMISYPNENEMLVKVETWNNFGEKVPLEITLTGPNL